MKIGGRENVTQRDIAERAGVTQMTVSLALRGAAGVSPETVKRIRALAEEMGYAPNPLVSSLMRTRRGRGDTKTGMTIAWHGAFTALRKQDRGRPDICDTYAEMLEGAHEACRRNGFRLEMFRFLEAGPEVPRIVRARGIRGLVLGPIGPNQLRGLNVDELKGVHLVRCERDLRESEYDRVVSNSFEEMRICVNALMVSGCKRIGYIDNGGHQDSSEDRWKGAYLANTRPGVRIIKPELEEMIRRNASAVLDEYIARHRLDGLVVGSRMFISAMLARDKRQGRIPFVCLERNAWPDWVSGVETNFRQIGAEAVQLLINRILSPHDPEMTRQTIAVHSDWHEGHSHLKS